MSYPPLYSLLARRRSGGAATSNATAAAGATSPRAFVFQPRRPPRT